MTNLAVRSPRATDLISVALTTALRPCAWAAFLNTRQFPTSTILCAWTYMHIPSSRVVVLDCINLQCVYIIYSVGLQTYGPKFSVKHLH
jgi:hypothetical protein